MCFSTSSRSVPLFQLCVPLALRQANKQHDLPRDYVIDRPVLYPDLSFWQASSTGKLSIRSIRPSMPKDDYSAVAGGRLKLKGVSDARVDKKKKKKKDKSKSKEADKDKSRESSEAPPKAITEGGDSGEADKSERRSKSRSRSRSVSEVPLHVGKTEAERRFEERKRRRLDERLMKEGVRSHKERVEEFNKYLANLSEHHDMYGISLIVFFCSVLGFYFLGANCCCV